MLYLKQRFADFLDNDVESDFVEGAPTHMTHLISHRKTVEMKKESPGSKDVATMTGSDISPLWSDGSFVVFA